MHPSTVFPLHCGIYLSESTGNMEKYESLICLHLCERKKRGLFLSHGKLHQTVVFGNIKTYWDIEAFKFLNSGLWLHSSMTSLVSAPNKKINANICISQTSPFFCGSSPEPLCLASFNRAKESHPDSGNSCLPSIFVMILSSTRQGSRQTFSEAAHIKIIFRRGFWSLALCWLRWNYSPRHSRSHLAPKWILKWFIYPNLSLPPQFIILGILRPT